MNMNILEECFDQENSFELSRFMLLSTQQTLKILCTAYSNSFNLNQSINSIDSC